MTSKTVAVAITLVANAVTSVVVLAVMLITLNGYSESDATYGMATWLICVLVCTLVTCAVAFSAVQALLKRKITAVKAVFIVSACTSIAAVLLNITCGFIGIAVAELMREYY